MLYTVERDRRMVEDWLIHYQERLEEYEEYTPIYPVCTTKIDGMPHGKGKAGKPTESIAIKGIITREQREADKRWLSVIREYIHSMPIEKRKIWELRVESERQKKRKVGRPSWCDTVAMGYVEWYAAYYGRECSVPHRNTIINWWREIVDGLYIVWLSNVGKRTD